MRILTPLRKITYMSRHTRHITCTNCFDACTWHCVLGAVGEAWRQLNVTAVSCHCVCHNLTCALLPACVLPLACRTLLKQRYSICAAKEMAAVGVTQRVDGIPSLVVLDSAGNALTLKGVADVQAHGAGAVDVWRQLTSAAASGAQPAATAAVQAVGAVCQKGGPC
jgi:hypothetical protein